MPALDTLIAFFLASAVFAYLPGPAMLYTSAQTIARGRKAGWMAALGIHIGGYVHVIAAALGLALLFKTVPVLYTALKFAGAAYLIWLGIRLIAVKGHSDRPVSELYIKSPRHAFWESISVEILNPKTALFFLAFLPQFTDISAAFPIWLQLAILGTIVNIMFSSADIVCVLLADAVTRLLKRSRRTNRLVQRLGGGILIALGANLAVNR